jgi:hypothetical protein
VLRFGTRLTTSLASYTIGAATGWRFSRSRFRSFHDSVHFHKASPLPLLHFLRSDRQHSKLQSLQTMAARATLLAVFVPGSASSFVAICAGQTSRPNVVFILADDKCYEAMRISHEPLG